MTTFFKSDKQTTNFQEPGKVTMQDITTISTVSPQGEALRQKSGPASPFKLTIAKGGNRG